MRELIIVLVAIIRGQGQWVFKKQKKKILTYQEIRSSGFCSQKLHIFLVPNFKAKTYLLPKVWAVYTYPNISNVNTLGPLE
jgi:hypothetical protein